MVSGLLRALGVRDSFDPGDFINTLSKLQLSTQINNDQSSSSQQVLTTDQLGLAVGMCKLLSRVGPTDRKKLKSNRLKVMAPDSEGKMARIQVIIYMRKGGDNKHIYNIC